ncbi:MAG: undecaprenyldiphospho-muramoylpentapeptide beta-N-acetylglucosaminyltransferase [Candidatus Margulisbacteria bacterium]|nr:undecaprenyldiphospho-muramoylpentapeptide beta-N-acetylglucosaminyltransferase [Candidatus Margulisiibacteriota bacterium]
MRIVIVSGGTGGHIYPGLAVAQEIKRRDKNSIIYFIGSHEGMEKDLVEREGFPIQLIYSRALLRKLSYKAISAPFVCLVGFFQAFSVLRRVKPKYLVATGGYASLPVILAARCKRIPVILLEQNAFPGAVNRLCRAFAQEAFLTFKESGKYIKGEVVGNPVRRQIIEADRESARRKLNLDDQQKLILIMGGSQGSKRMNEAVVNALDQLPPGNKIFHIVGVRDFAWVSQKLAGKELINYQSLAYVHNIADYLAAADLVISRAGATAIAEFLVLGLPMILVPFPYAAGDHQRLNAKSIAEAGAAIVVEDSDFTPDKFLSIISDFPSNYGRMKESAKKIAKPDAAERIVDFIYA